MTNHDRRTGTTLRSTALLALGVLALAAPAATAAPAPPAPRLWSFAGSMALDAPETAGADLVRLRPTLCAPDPAGKPLTLEGALRSARSIVVAASGSRAVQAFERSPTAQSAVSARAAAVAMFAKGRSAAALLALLRLHQLAPDDPSTLSSISAVLNVLGHSRESLAVARAADAMRPAPASAMGINGQAMLLSNEGQALAGLGRYGAAERLLRRSVRLAPELSEAKVNLAVSLLCQQQDVDAVRFYRLGRYREAYHLVDTGDPAMPQSLPLDDEVYDLSQGVDGMFPTVRIPNSWTELVTGAWNPGNAQEVAALHDEFSARLAHFQQLDRDLTAKIDWQHLPPLQVQRFFRLMVAIYGARFQPDIAPLYDHMWEVRQELVDFYADYFRSGGPSKLGDLYTARQSWPECHQPGGGCDARWQRECSDLNTTQHARWLTLAQEYDRSLRALYGAEYRRQTALAANLADPAFRRLALIRIEGDQTPYLQLLNELSSWGTWLGDSGCRASGTQEPIKQDDGFQQEPDGGCASFLKGVKFSVKLGSFVKLSANCEQLGLEVAGKGDFLWIGPFGEGSIDFKRGSGTIFVGAKAAGKIPETGTGVSVKEGVYATFGNTGLKDVGMRVSSSASFGLSSGPTVDVKGPGYQISFVSQTISF